jgi:hypothetical protein
MKTSGYRNRKRQWVLWGMLLFALTARPGLAIAGEKPAPLIPLRVDTPPVIDGILDDPVWATAPFETGFKTWRPDFGKDMHEKTAVYYAYDRENLYFAYRCEDSEPSKIKASIAARDTIIPDDWVCLNIDTFNDQQSMYAFYANPLGIQADAKFEANVEDFSVDIVWFSAGRIDERGYTVEIRIPFKSIRYQEHEPVEMGIVFERNISRYSEDGTVPALDPAQALNFLTQTRTLFFRDIKHYTLLEFLPAATHGRTSLIDRGRLEPQKAKSGLGLTAKYGLTSQLILDGTVNPDFSQVESDAGQVDFNLRNALFYPEKRPFFLEGQEKFTLAATESGNPLETVVNTRTIVNPLLGFKLIGKVSPKDTIASIYALDELPSESPNDSANVTIVRYKHALSDDSYIGGVWTSRFEGSGYNVVAGSDGFIRLDPTTFFAYHALIAQTKDKGPGDAVEGHALGLMYFYTTRERALEISVQDVSRDFAAETGYLTRNGLTRLKVGFMPMIYPKSATFLRIDPIFHTINIYDKFSGLLETYDTFDLRLILPRNTTLIAGGRYQTEVFLGQRFGRSGFRLIGSSQLTKQLSLDWRYNYGGKIRYCDSPYQGRGSDASFSAAYLPSEKLRLDLSLIYSDFFRSAGGAKEYDYTILRGLTSYQLNKYLFVRAIVEYNSFYKQLMTDFLASFTYIPGTVVHLGYGSLYEKLEWQDEDYTPSDRFLETQRSFFFKVSYLWRM